MPLARGQLALGVLGGDAVLAAAEPGRRAAPLEFLKDLHLGVLPGFPSCRVTHRSAAPEALSSVFANDCKHGPRLICVFRSTLVPARDLRARAHGQEPLLPLSRTHDLET